MSSRKDSIPSVLFSAKRFTSLQAFEAELHHTFKKAQELNILEEANFLITEKMPKTEILSIASKFLTTGD